MVENTWPWATNQGKVYTHPINKAEYVDLDVEQCRETQRARVQEIASSSAFDLKDRFRVQFFKETLDLDFYNPVATHVCVCFQDDSGSIFDELDTGRVAKTDASSGALPNQPVPQPIPPL